MRSKTEKESRRQVASVSVLGTTQIHPRSPVVIACWSIVFPGLGHLLLSRYLRGYLLFIGEFLINFEAHINMGLLYTLTGRFEAAKHVLDIRWLALYFPFYLFAIWDSYRATIDINAQYILAAREGAEIKPFVINGLELNYNDKRSPWVAAAWSFLMPGTGQLYLHHITATVFLLVWWVADVYNSNILTAIQLTLLGNPASAAAVVNPQWLLNIPSLYLFAIYDAYEDTVELNNLYEWEQDRFLEREYRYVANIRSVFNAGKEDQNMYVVSTFEHSKFLEFALTALEMAGVAKEGILAITLDKRNEKRSLFDTIHHSDNLSLIDLPLILATFFAIFGTIYGFILPWGPVIWGLISIGAGFALGLGIKLFTARKYLKGRTELKKAAEVVVMVNCRENQLDKVKEILWDNHAMGVRQLGQA